jgi:hypothetical protein
MELQLKRQLLVGDGADPALSDTVISILFSRGHLDEKDAKGEVLPEVARERYEAAKRYRRLRCAVFGAPWPSNAVGRDVSEAHLAKLKRDFVSIVGFWVPLAEWCPSQEPEIRFRQGQLAREQVVIVENVCVFDHKPYWFDAQRLGLEHDDLVAPVEL